MPHDTAVTERASEAASSSAWASNPTFAIALSACLGCIILALANIYRGQVVEWVVADPDQTATRLRLLLAMLAIVAVFPVGLLSYFSGRLSHAITISGRYPPPGIAMRRSIAVREGRDAYRTARALRLAAIALGGIAAAIPIVFWLLAASLTPS